MHVYIPPTGRDTIFHVLAALVSDGSGVRANDVYAMLAQEVLYTDLYAVPLIQHVRVHLYLDLAQAQAYAHLKPSRLLHHAGVPDLAPLSWREQMRVY